MDHMEEVAQLVTTIEGVCHGRSMGLVFDAMCSLVVRLALQKDAQRRAEMSEALRLMSELVDALGDEQGVEALATLARHRAALQAAGVLGS